MKSVEKESLLKSFLLFFLSMGVMVIVNAYLNYNRLLIELDNHIKSKMQICSYDLNCSEYKFDFVDLKQDRLNILTHSKDGSIYSDFSIPDSNVYALRVILPNSVYEQKKLKLLTDIYNQLLIALFIVVLLSIIFALYTLRPLRMALNLMEEFVRDIMHDFNTPLSTIRINVAMMQKQMPDKKELQRIERGVGAIVDLQQNLREYLEKITSNASRVELSKVIPSRIEIIQGSFPDINFELNIEPSVVIVEPKKFVRVIDNILSNAAKYNIENGSVSIEFSKKSGILTIKDTGIGIAEPNRVFERFYHETSKGSGIGMHIVKKLCDSLGIDIEIKSKVSEGTTVKLNLNRVLSDISNR